MKKVEGSQKSMEDLQKSSNNPPWIELLDSLIEIIIEKLPVVDYIRFGIICKRWHSIQKEHRIRYSPNPPPTAPSVVLVNYKYNWDGSNWENDKQLFFHIPFDQKKYRLPLPYLSPSTIFVFCYGWILIYHKTCPSSHEYFNIYNPVTGVMIKLSRFPTQYLAGVPRYGSMSAPPTDPNCCIIISTYCDIFVLVLRDLVWKKVQVPHNYDAYTSSGFVYLKGKFYRTSIFEEKSLCVVDPFLSKPVEQNLELDITETIERRRCDAKYERLTVIDGELFLVIVVYPRDKRKNNRFYVFRANFTTNEWIRVTSLRDYAMLVSDNGLCLPVNCVEGFKKNMIYFTQKFNIDDHVDRPAIIKFRVAWMTFDMDSQEIAEGPSFLYDKDEFDVDDTSVDYTFKLLWFFPTL